MHFYLLLLHGELTVKSIQPAKFGLFFLPDRGLRGLLVLSFVLIL